MVEERITLETGCRPSLFLEKSINEQIEKIKGKNVVETSYGELCQRPLGVLCRVQDVLRKNGCETELLSEPPASFSPKTNYGENPDYELVRNAISKLYNGHRLPE